jgi:hypothetical protein
LFENAITSAGTRRRKAEHMRLHQISVSRSRQFEGNETPLSCLLNSTSKWQLDPDDRSAATAASAVRSRTRLSTWESCEWCGEAMAGIWLNHLAPSLLVGGSSCIFKLRRCCERKTLTTSQVAQRRRKVFNLLLKPGRAGSEPLWWNHKGTDVESIGVRCVCYGRFDG